jgi:hypothetical protein
LDDDEAEAALAAHAGDRLALIAESHARLTGQALVAPQPVAKPLWRLPAVVLAHGTEADPLFFWANKAALDLFELDWRALVRMPSRLSAEAPNRTERAALLETVARQGFIRDYAGVRISASGRRFRIERATVWNLVDADGGLRGQAASFSDWTRLD